MNFGFLASRPIREQICVVLSHQSWGNLLQQQEANTENLAVTISISLSVTLPAIGQTATIQSDRMQ